LSAIFLLASPMKARSALVIGRLAPNAAPNANLLQTRLGFGRELLGVVKRLNALLLAFDERVPKISVARSVAPDAVEDT
jgi:hypothetical protein